MMLNVPALHPFLEEASWSKIPGETPRASNKRSKIKLFKQT